MLITVNAFLMSQDGSGRWRSTRSAEACTTLQPSDAVYFLVFVI